MEQTKGHQHHEQDQQQDHARRDDLTWTQFITNLAANKLAPPKSQTLKVLEDHLARLNDEILGGEARIGERLGGDDQDSPLTRNVGSENRESEKEGMAVAARGGLGEALAANKDGGQLLEGSSIVLETADIKTVSFSGGYEITRPSGQVQQLHHEMLQGARWIDVLWQFISAHQKRVLDLDRLGVEPSERMDLQVDMIRQIAATYEKLGLLTKLPDSLSEARECKVADDIRTMALVYVARKMMDVSSPEEIADADDEKRKQIIDFPRSVISPYEGIRPIEIDPMELIKAA